MGRKRIDENEKKITVTVSLKRKNFELLKKQGSISEIIQKLVDQYLYKK